MGGRGRGKGEEEMVRWVGGGGGWVFVVLICLSDHITSWIDLLDDNSIVWKFQCDATRTRISSPLSLRPARLCRAGAGCNIQTIYKKIEHKEEFAKEEP